jgi:hypothetical protein
LTNNKTSWRSVHSDHFDDDQLGDWWHFLTKGAAAGFSLSQRKGWVRLKPDSGRTHLVQKETDHFYSVVTKLELSSSDPAVRGGIYLTNGNQGVFVRLFSGSNNNSNIVLQLDTATRRVAYPQGKTVWLKLERYAHQLSGYFSTDGKQWQSVGAPISAVPLDKVQPNYNSWVGTSVGLFAEGGPVDFDLFVCKDGFSSMPAIGNSNYYGIQVIKTDSDRLVTNNSLHGGWLMLSGVDFGWANEAKAIEVIASATKTGVVDILVDDLQGGEHIAAVPVKAGKKGRHVYQLRAAAGKLSGQHDLFVRFPAGASQHISIESIRLLRTKK